MGILAAVGAGAAGLFGAGAAAFVGTGVLAGIIGGALVGAAIGGLTAALTGGNILEGVLFGAVGGAVTGGVATWASGATMMSAAPSGGLSGATQTLGATAAQGGTIAKESVSIGGMFSSVGGSTQTASGWSIGASFLEKGIASYMGSEQSKSDAEAAILAREDAQQHAKDMAELQASLMGGGGGGGGASHDPANMARIEEERRQFNLSRQDRIDMQKARGGAVGGALGGPRKEFVTKPDEEEIVRHDQGLPVGDKTELPPEAKVEEIEEVSAMQGMG